MWRTILKIFWKLNKAWRLGGVLEKLRWIGTWPEGSRCRCRCSSVSARADDDMPAILVLVSSCGQKRKRKQAQGSPTTEVDWRGKKINEKTRSRTTELLERQKTKNQNYSFFAVSVDRTRDLQIFSLTLSQLSYPRLIESFV